MRKLFILLIVLMFLGITICYAEQPIAKPVKEPIKIQSMELTNIPITTAIAQIARAGELSVAISPEVPNTIITATFKNVPAELALQTVCDAAGLLNQKKEDNVYIVSPRIRVTGGVSAMMEEMSTPPTLLGVNNLDDKDTVKFARKQSIPTIQACPVCKRSFRTFSKERYCPYCGSNIISKCKYCGKRITDSNWSYCPYCGKKIKK